MKTFLVLFFVLIFGDANAANKKSISANTSINMKMYYTEIIPGGSVEFKIEHKKYCPKDNLSIRQFESEDNLSSTEISKKVPVRILNVHVRFFSPCSSNSKMVSESLKIQGDNSRMTHVYLFSDLNINVTH